jgi:V8-like Glu-specific endopeptidase
MKPKIKLLVKLFALTCTSFMSLKIQATELGIRKPVSAQINSAPPSVAIIKDNNFFLSELFRLKDTYRFCNNAKFEDDLMWASCSGTVVGEDLVVTAAHCLTAQNDCSDMTIATEFNSNEDIELIRKSPEKVFRCKKVIYSSEPRPGNHDRDIAILQLDRPVQGRQSAKIVANWNPDNEFIYAAGYPSGTSKKISVGFSSNENFPDINLKNLEYRKISLLAPPGLSGGGVFNSRNQLVGVVVRSNTSYIREERCVRDFSCSTDDCPWTEVQIIDSQILGLLGL